MDSIGALSTSSTTTAQTSQAAKPTTEPTAAVKTSSDTDGNTDTRTTEAAAVPIAPTVNLSGQKIGQIINESA